MTAEQTQTSIADGASTTCHHWCTACNQNYMYGTCDESAAIRPTVQNVNEAPPGTNVKVR